MRRVVLLDHRSEMQPTTEQEEVQGCASRKKAPGESRTLISALRRPRRTLGPPGHDTPGGSRTLISRDYGSQRRTLGPPGQKAVYPSSKGKPVSSADLLESALTTLDIRMALQSAQTLGQQPESVPALLPHLAAALNDELPLIARRAAHIHAVLGSVARDNVQALLAALHHRRWTVREAVIVALGKVALEDEAVQSALVHLSLNDRNRAVRALAVTILGDQTGTFLPPVRAALAHHHPRIRCRALHALARLGSLEEQASVLQAALEDSHFRVRRDAARLLGGLGGAAIKVLPRLARCRFDGEPRMARAAAKSLARIASEAPPVIAEWLNRMARSTDPEPSLRSALQANDLPAPVSDSFVSVCHRRQYRLARRGDYPPPTCPDQPLAAVDALLIAVGKHSRREAAWLIGWLLAELLRHHQGTTR